MLGHQPMMGQPMMGGYNYNPQMMGQPAQKIMNNLTEDEINLLMQNASQFSLNLTQREALQGACNHRVKDGSKDSLTYDPTTGVAHCTICGYEFRPIDPDTSVDDIIDAKDKIIDILQTIKLLYTDLPAEAARDYFQVIPLLQKLPELFQFAGKNFAKHEMMNAWQYQGANMGGYAMLQNLGNFFGAGQMPYQQPMMQQPVAPAPMAGMAAGFPQAAYNPTVPGMNAFGYQGASQPMNQGYAYQPGMVAPQAPVAPAAPAEAAAPAATETVTQPVQA